MEEEKLGQPSTALFKYAKLILYKEETTSAGGCGVSHAAFHALCQSVVMTVRRRAFFIVWKEVA